MFLYCISDGHSRCKFGYSQDPAGRLRSLQTGNSSSLELLETVSVPPHCVRELEVLLHREIGLHRRLKGEWFEIDAQSARALLSWFEIRYL